MTPALAELAPECRRRPGDRRMVAARRTATRRGRRRGAARDPRRRRAARGDDAHARPRRGARARVPLRRGADRRAARAPGLTEDFAANIDRGRGAAAARPGRALASTRPPRAACAARARSRRSRSHAPPLPDGPTIARALLAALPERLRQPGFARTGGLHATGLFDADGRAADRARGRRPPQRDGQGRSAARCSTGCCRCTSSSSASAAGCRSSSSRRPRSPARRSSSASARRPRWRSSSPPTSPAG